MTASTVDTVATNMSDVSSCAIPSTETVNLAAVPITTKPNSGSTPVNRDPNVTPVQETAHNSLQDSANQIRGLLERILKVQSRLGEINRDSYAHGGAITNPDTTGLVIQNPGFPNQAFMLHLDGKTEWYGANGRPRDDFDVVQFQSFWRRLDEHCMSRVSIHKRVTVSALESAMISLR